MSQKNNIFSYLDRHIGTSYSQQKEMLSKLSSHSELQDINAFIEMIIPQKAKRTYPLNNIEAFSEYQYTKHINQLMSKNNSFVSLIGQGYYPSITPSIILRMILENPGFYTAYTPYQAEISQGRLELLFHFQSLITQLTQLPIANASLLDESTAIAEAIALLYRSRSKEKQDAQTVLVANPLFKQHKRVIETRAKGLGLSIIYTEDITKQNTKIIKSSFAAIIAYPDATGHVENPSKIQAFCDTNQIKTIYCCDALALLLLESPGSLGADVSVGSTQRFGIPLGFGGPHAAFIAVKEEYKRHMPGRIIGKSQDKYNNTAYRMALQTREQHIRREKATSNICTAQALLAMMAAAYAIYHGPEGLEQIALNIHKQTCFLAKQLKHLGYKLHSESFFDTLLIDCGENISSLITDFESSGFLVHLASNSSIQLSLCEGLSDAQINSILEVFSKYKNKKINPESSPCNTKNNLSIRVDKPLRVPIFETYHKESTFTRYIKSLENKDLSLTHAMIPLGSCTMKLNSATAMKALSNPNLSTIHPFAPKAYTQGYLEMISTLGDYLCDICEMEGVSFQPNSGAQGEYAGLLVIDQYLKAKEDTKRHVVFIPTSAHGTNPASAMIAGFDVVAIACDEDGNIDQEDFNLKLEKNKDTLAAMMITYPSTFGVFERGLADLCQKIHQVGALVYMDGANLNAQVGLCSPGAIGADVVHINLHKTFSIPHGGGGPGMGPICVKKHLIDFLPQNPLEESKAAYSVASSSYSSASILQISYATIKMLGSEGLSQATKVAILHANYMAKRLSGHYSILFTGPKGFVAHEFIIDCRVFKKSAHIDVEDIAKRLMDYGCHAPTMSWPVAGTLMIEPTESESKEEMDRFCDAMICIRNEIKAIEEGLVDSKNNLLKNAPHPLSTFMDMDWPYPYSRVEAAYPLGQTKKPIWPTVARIDNAYGDRNLVCSCSVDLEDNLDTKKKTKEILV